jgi:hypothetical protein
MRQAFIIFAIALWVIINLFGNIAEQETILGQTDTKTGLTQEETLNALTKPDVTDVNLLTIFTKIRDVLFLLGKIFTLYHPALWQNEAMLIYFGLILPVGISFWVIAILAIRGVGSS